jgi:predicted cupin superfamily sugar epimerase
VVRSLHSTGPWRHTAPGCLSLDARGNATSRKGRNALTLMYELLQVWGTCSMFHSVNDPSYWLDRAEHMRELAEQSRDAEAKAAMLGIASEYEMLAEVPPHLRKARA